MLKKSIISGTLVGVVALALASSGGGDKKNSAAKSGLLSMKSSSGYRLKAGPDYSKSHFFNAHNLSTRNSVVTYRKGNTFYILPVQGNKSVVKSQYKSNLSVLSVKLRLNSK